MDLTRTAYGTWSGGRFMRFGEALEEERFVNVIRMAYEQGVRTFMTADAYGAGAADEMLGRALEGFDRDSYCLVGSVGHDFYEGQRLGARGFPRFTHPELCRDYPVTSKWRWKSRWNVSRRIIGSSYASQPGLHGLHPTNLEW